MLFWRTGTYGNQYTFFPPLLTSIKLWMINHLSYKGKDLLIAPLWEAQAWTQYHLHCVLIHYPCQGRCFRKLWWTMSQNICVHVEFLCTALSKNFQPLQVEDLINGHLPLDGYNSKYWLERQDWSLYLQIYPFTLLPLTVACTTYYFLPYSSNHRSTKISLWNRKG